MHWHLMYRIFWCALLSRQTLSNLRSSYQGWFGSLSERRVIWKYINMSYPLNNSKVYIWSQNYRSERRKEKKWWLFLMQCERCAIYSVGWLKAGSSRSQTSSHKFTIDSADSAFSLLISSILKWKQKLFQIFTYFQGLWIFFILTLLVFWTFRTYQNIILHSLSHLSLTHHVAIKLSTSSKKKPVFWLTGWCRGCELAVSITARTLKQQESSYWLLWLSLTLVLNSRVKLLGRLQPHKENVSDSPVCQIKLMWHPLF